MRKGSRWVGLVVSLALVVVMTVGTISAQGKNKHDYTAKNYKADYWLSSVYKIYHTNYTQFVIVKAMTAYTAEARRAAVHSVGNRTGYTGYINVYLKPKGKNGTYASAPWGGTNFTLNTSYGWTPKHWGSLLAHESSHVYFYQYTKAVNWDSKSTSPMLYHRTWLTESLAWYAGSMVYKYGSMFHKKGSQHSKASVKSELLRCYSKDKAIISAFGTGYYYRNGGYGEHTRFQLMAQGYFLANNFGYSKLSSLMNNLRTHSSSAGKYIRSASINAADYYFEHSFFLAYDFYVNARWQHANYRDGSGKFLPSTSYLMGKFYYQWYV